MKKPKFIEGHDSLKYKRQLAELMQQVNPKDAPEIIEKLRQKYQAQRGGY